MAKNKRPRITINLKELDRIVDQANERVLQPAETEKLKRAIHLLAESAADQKRTSERAKAIFGGSMPDEETKVSEQEAPKSSEAPQKEKAHRPGHGRNGQAAFTGATHIPVPNADLEAGCACPECLRGKVYSQKARARVRIVGRAPLHANIYDLECLRCNLCGVTFTAEAPEGCGDEKYDASAVSMVAVLKYGAGMPFNRIESMQEKLGVPLPSSTQYDLMEDAAEQLKPILQEVYHQAAQGSELHSDDTSMEVISVPRLDADTRTGLFTTGVLSMHSDKKIALYFTGTRHAGENMQDLLRHRNQNLAAPTLMCDALSRNVPKGNPDRFELANCLTHGRRHFVDVADNFPAECRHVLDVLGSVYGNEKETLGMSAQERMRFHQERSGPLLKELHRWLSQHLDEKKTEPNSGLGKAMKYMLRHWKPLTLFLRQPGAPLDNNVCERALKMVVLHRKNALFYRTLNGAEVGDLFMSLIQTCSLNHINPYDYLTEVLRHVEDVQKARHEWMPWNYQATLARAAPA